MHAIPAVEDDGADQIADLIFTASLTPSSTAT
jgi:hypothetical protein